MSDLPSGPYFNFTTFRCLFSFEAPYSPEWPESTLDKPAFAWDPGPTDSSWGYTSAWSKNSPSISQSLALPRSWNAPACAVMTFARGCRGWHEAPGAPRAAQALGNGKAERGRNSGLHMF